MGHPDPAEHRAGRRHASAFAGVALPAMRTSPLLLIPDVPVIASRSSIVRIEASARSLVPYCVSNFSTQLGRSEIASINSLDFLNGRKRDLQHESDVTGECDNSNCPERSFDLRLGENVLVPQPSR
jgi:hypothetical protein